MEYENIGDAERFLFGLEESYSYLRGTYTRDKDEEELSVDIEETLDYTKGAEGLLKSNALKFILKDGWIAARLSGAETKIQCYYGIKSQNKEALVLRMDEINAVFDDIL